MPPTCSYDICSSVTPKWRSSICIKIMWGFFTISALLNPSNFRPHWSIIDLCLNVFSADMLRISFELNLKDPQFSSVQYLSRVQLFVTPQAAARQASLSLTNSQSLLKLTSIESVMPSNHLILCRPLLLPPSIFPSLRVFSSESFLHINCPEYWSFSFSISPFNEYSGLISFRMDWLGLLAVQRTLKNPQCIFSIYFRSSVYLKKYLKNDQEWRTYIYIYHIYIYIYIIFLYVIFPPENL